MADSPGLSEPWDGLRRATVRLVDPADPRHWGTGFFIARNVLLTCWHVVRDVADQRVRVEQPDAGQGAAGSIEWHNLGEAILLEEGKPWDLALLSFQPSRVDAFADQARAAMGLPLGERDPLPEALLLSSGFPEDAASRHDATYAAAGRTTPEGQSMDYLRLKADGVVQGVSGAALVEATTGKVCGVLARNELPGGASDGGLAVPLAVFLDAFPKHGEAVLRRNRLECQEGGTAIQPRLGRPDWSWPPPLDSAHHRAEKREGFVGRDWLFDEVRAWARGGPERALLITADFGVGKSAFLAELVDRAHDTPGLESQGKEHVGPETLGDGHHNAGIPIAAHHFCDHATNATLAPGEFVTNVATQLAQALPAYRAALEADDAERLRDRLDDANRDPGSAWDQAVVAPLARIPPPAAPLLLVVDALDEALEHRHDSSGAPALTIVDLLARHTPRLPSWLRVLATSRDREEVRGPLGQAFQPRHIDAERAANLDDLHAYALGRCRQGDLAERLATAHLRPEPLAAKLRELSGGKFLYAVRVLHELATGALPLLSAGDLERLPAGMEAFYRDTFQRRFPPTEKEAYGLARPLLALLCAQREPLALGTLAALTGQSPAEVEAALEPVDDLLRRSPVPATEGEDWTLRLDHFSLEQWLSERNERGRWKAGAYAVDREAAAGRLHAWALAEVAAGRAHRWPYLVRHLASHLSAEERPGVIAGLLGEFAWLEARLRMVGMKELLQEFTQAALTPRLEKLERALQQRAHVLNQNDCWRGHEQLASQLLAKLAEDGDRQGPWSLRAQAMDWVKTSGGAIPLTTSLAAHEALIRTFPVNVELDALVKFPDGNLASADWMHTIRLWNLASGTCTAVFEGHKNLVNVLTVLDDWRLASGSVDETIRIWDRASGACTAVFEGHKGSVEALAVLDDGRLASGSCDNTIRLWDPATGTCTAVFEAGKYVHSLAVLSDGRLASGSYEKTIRLWDTATCTCTAILEGHQGGVYALAALGDGRLASASSDKTIRLWDPASGACLTVFEGHQAPVFDLSVVDDRRLASAEDKTIRIWDLAKGACSGVLEGHEDWVTSLVMLGDGRLASCSHDCTIRLWEPGTGDCHEASQEHEELIKCLVVLNNGQLASSSADQTIRLWDSASGACSAVFHVQNFLCGPLAELGNRHLAFASYDQSIYLLDSISGSCIDVFEGYPARIHISEFGYSAHALAVLSDGRVVSDSVDNKIQLWDPTTGACEDVFEGHQGSVNALTVLGDGRLASGSFDNTIRLWDPATGACTAVFEGHQGGVLALAVLADGRLASSSLDNTIRIWDPATGACTTIFKGHRHKAWTLAALRDGRLASACVSDRTILLWDPARPDGAPRVIFVADAAITALVTHPSRPLLVAGDSSGRLHWLEFPTAH